MKREWGKPTIEILDINKTMKGFKPPKPSKPPIDPPIVPPFPDELDS